MHPSCGPPCQHLRYPLSIISMTAGDASPVKQQWARRALRMGLIGWHHRASLQCVLTACLPVFVLCCAVLQLGFTLSLYYLAVWVGCGLTVWRAIGIW
jgi:hypothetical protein